MRDTNANFGQNWNSFTHTLAHTMLPPPPPPRSEDTVHRQCRSDTIQNIPHPALCCALGVMKSIPKWTQTPETRKCFKSHCISHVQIDRMCSGRNVRSKSAYRIEILWPRQGCRCKKCDYVACGIADGSGTHMPNSSLQNFLLQLLFDTILPSLQSFFFWPHFVFLDINIRDSATPVLTVYIRRSDMQSKFLFIVMQIPPMVILEMSEKWCPLLTIGSGNHRILSFQSRYISYFIVVRN